MNEEDLMRKLSDVYSNYKTDENTQHFRAELSKIIDVVDDLTKNRTQGTRDMVEMMRKDSENNPLSNEQEVTHTLSGVKALIRIAFS